VKPKIAPTSFDPGTTSFSSVHDTAGGTATRITIRDPVFPHPNAIHRPASATVVNPALSTVKW
jgi:hypothetical protein